MSKTKRIIFENKPIYLPFADADYGGDTMMKLETISNRFAKGQKAVLPKFAVAVYDVIMGAEVLATAHDKIVGQGGSPYWNNHRKGLDWFIKYFPEDYMTLLD